MLHATHESMMHYHISPKFFLTHVSGKRTRDCSSLICCTSARPSCLAFFSLCMKLGSYLSFHMNDFTNWSKPSRAAFDFCFKAPERFQSPDIHISLVSASASCSFNWYPWSALRAFDSPRRGPSFPKQFTVGVLNSILKCVRLVSGAVSASGRFVFQFICLPIHLSPRSCVRGCVRLRGICLPIHLSPNSFVSQVLCQGLCPPPGDLSPNSFVRLVSGAVSASGRFVSQFICLPIHLSPRSLSPNSFVSQVLWQGLCPPPGDWFPNSFVSQFICLPGPVSRAVSAFGGFVSQFVCLPPFPKQLSVGVLNSILRCVRLVSGAVSASLGSVSPISPQTVYCWRSQFSFKRCPAMFRWWCLALRMSRIHLSPYITFVSQSGWWCPALRLSPIHLSPLVATHLSPNLAGGVRLWLSPIHLSCLVATHLSPSLAGGARLFGCLSHAGDVRLFGCL